MRKINLKRDESRKKRRNQLIAGLVLILIMFFSTVGYSFIGFNKEQENQGNTEKIIYKSFEFTKQNSFWLLNKDGINFVFKYNPKQLEGFNHGLIFLTMSNYYGKPLYIYSENIESEFEIYRNFDRISQRMQSACLEQEQNCKENSPIKTCEDNFIIIKPSNSSEIIRENNCIFINGPSQDLVKLTDEFLFKILGI